MDQTLITVLRYSITYYQKDLFICTQYANKHKAKHVVRERLHCHQCNCLHMMTEKSTSLSSANGPLAKMCKTILNFFQHLQHTYVSLQLRMQNAVSTQPCVGKLGISLVLLNFLDCNFRLWFKTP